MLDKNEFAKNFDARLARLKDRGGNLNLTAFEEKMARRKALNIEVQGLEEKRKASSEAMSKADPATREAKRPELKALGEQLKERQAERDAVEADLDALMLQIPNVPHESVPKGAGADDNQVVRTWGEKPTFTFTPKQHFEVGEKLGMLDFERATKVSGPRFAFLKGPLARLERALVSFMIDEQVANGYQELLPPYLVNRGSMTGTGQLPKFEEDAFKTAGDQELFLIPTAEVPVTNYHADEIIEADELPRKYCAFSPCFRAEAGAAGKDTRGLIRMHQFHKVEIVQFVQPDKSMEALEQLTGHAQGILQKLGLHHRVVLLCTGDMGFASQKTYDLEVWLPGQNAFREISSCSNFGDFQARRAKIRWRPEKGGKPQPLHTLNGSGLAVGRTLVAILENFQREDGSVVVPEALRSYVGASEIRPV